MPPQRRCAAGKHSPIEKAEGGLDETQAGGVGGLQDTHVEISGEMLISTRNLNMPFLFGLNGLRSKGECVIFEAMRLQKRTPRGAPRRKKAPWSVQEKAQSTTNRPPYRRCVSYPHHLPVRLSTQEREQIDRAAKEAGLSLSRYVVKTITQGRYPPTLKDKEGLFSIRFQLERAGVNLNQIAKQLNALALGTTERVPALAEIRGAVRTLKTLCQDVERRMT